MSTVHESEKEKYQKAWADPWYRKTSPAERDLSRFVQMTHLKAADVILDVGCGTGRASLELWRRGFNVHMVDITETCLDPEVLAQLERLEKDNLDGPGLWFDECPAWDMQAVDEADIIHCVDVMEHLPPDKVREALAEFVSIGAREIYLQIALFPHEHEGQTLHLTVKPADWWSNLLQEYFDVLNWQENGSHVWCVLTARVD